MAAKKERIVWIDQLRAIAFFTVILGHMIGDRNPFDIWIYSFHMPLFFIISGFNLNFEKMAKTKFLSFLKHSTERLLVPYFWLMSSMIIFRYMVDYDKATPGYVFRYIAGAVIGNNRIMDFASIPMYFILLIFLAQLCFWLFSRFVGNNAGKMLMLVLPLTAISITTQYKPVIWHLNVLPTALLFMLTGKLIMTFLRENEKKISHISLPAYLAICLVLFVAGYFIQKYNTRVSLNTNVIGKDYMLYFVSAVMTSVAFILLVMKLPNTKILTYIGQNTLFFLGIHEPMMYPFETLLPDFFSKPVGIALLSVCFYLVPVPIVWFFNRYMPYFNGNSLKKLTPVTKAAKIIAVMFALLPVYVSLMRFAFDGILMKDWVCTVLSIAVYVGLSVGIERLFSLKLPFMFCQHIEKKRIKRSAPIRTPQRTVEVRTQQIFAHIPSEEAEQVLVPVEE